MVKCGVSEVVITPELGGEIPGYYEARISNDKFDDLMAKALVFYDGKLLTGICVLDVCYFQVEHVVKVRERIEKLLGIDASQIMVSATHTHTGANIDTTGIDICVATQEEVDRIINKAADAVVYAFRRLQPFKIGFGRTTETEVSFNRRWWMKDGVVHTWPGVMNPDNVKPAAGIDPDVTVLRIDTPDDKPIAVITNFANHLDTAGGGYKYCADYPGEISRQIKKELGTDVISIFMTGCCGDITHVDYSGKYPLVENQHVLIGKKLAEDVLGIYPNIKTGEASKIGSIITEKTVKRRQFSKEQYEEALLTLKKAEEYTPSEKIDQSDEEFAKPTTGDMFLMELTYAKATKKLYEHPVYEDTIVLQTIRVGNIVFNGLPGEIFHELGIEMRDRSKFDCSVMVELANDYHSYIATEKAYGEGGYETTLDSYMNLEPKTGNIIVNNILDMQEELERE